MAGHPREGIGSLKKHVKITLLGKNPEKFNSTEGGLFNAMLKKSLNLVVSRTKKIQYIDCPKAPDAIGPYVHATRFGDTIWVSGQVGIDGETGDMSGDNAACQAKQALFNIQNILEECGASMSSVVKTTLILKDMDDFQEVNEVYSKFFDGKGYPARACFEVSDLRKGGLVEIEAFAVVESGEKDDDL